MSNNDSDSGQNSGKEGTPVMPCQTADGGMTRRETRALPIDPRRRRSEVRRLSELMFFRCTPEDKIIIEANAEKVGVEKSTYMRIQSTGNPIMKTLRRISVDWDILRHSVGVINKVGNVVNQAVVELRRHGYSASLATGARDELIAAARAIVAMMKQM